MARRTYEMSDKDLEILLEASKAPPVMYLSGGKPMFPSAQETANAAWKVLGERMGFDYMTVKLGPSRKIFTAEEEKENE